jgi:hypothetical protein
MKLDVFGKEVEVLRVKNQWQIFYLGNEGKKRLATDVVIPSSTKEQDIASYLADIFHESATAQNPEVKIID